MYLQPIDGFSLIVNPNKAKCMFLKASTGSANITFLSCLLSRTDHMAWPATVWQCCDRGKQWHSPDRVGRLQPGRQNVGGSQKCNKPYQPHL